MNTRSTQEHKASIHFNITSRILE